MITQAQLAYFMKELLDLGHVCNGYELVRYPLFLDPDVFDALDDALVEWSRGNFPDYPESRRWFDGQRMLCGFEIIRRPNRCPGCGANFDEFPEMKHAPEDCFGPGCTCYEPQYGHQPGCPQRAR